MRSFLSTTRWGSFWAAIALAIGAWMGAALGLAPLAARVAPGSPLAEALAAARGATRDVVLILLGLAVVAPAVVALLKAPARGWVRPATPRALGATRAWVAAILLANVAWENLPSSAYLPRGMLDLDSHWIVGTLHRLPIGFDLFLRSPAALGAYQALTALLLVLALVGLHTRWTVPAAAVAYLLFAAILRSYAWSYHMGLVPLLLLLLLSVTPCGDAFSLDRRRRLRRGESLPPTELPTLAHGLGQYLVWMGVAVPYVMAGLSKLRNTGLDWWRGEHLQQMVIATIVEPMHFDFQLAFRLLHAPGWTFDLLGFVALATEVTFGLVLVHRLARLVLPALMAGAHVGILLLQNILFPDLIAIQAVFYDWTPLERRLLGRWRGGRAEAGSAGALPDLAPALRRQSRVAAGFLVVALIVWATRTEKFPLTAMQMFSRPVPLEPVEYVRPLALYEDGSVEAARFERWIGALADSRYRRLIRDWEPERVGVLHEFLDVAALRANATAEPGRRVVGFRLERRRWDFRRDPGDPGRGVVEEVLMHPVARTW